MRIVLTPVFFVLLAAFAGACAGPAVGVDRLPTSAAHTAGLVP